MDLISVQLASLYKPQPNYQEHNRETNDPSVHRGGLIFQRKM